MNPFFLFLLLYAQFATIDETIPDGPFIYPGSRSREVIVVDPSSSPYLDAKYAELLRRLPKDRSEQFRLAFIARFIREEVFSPSRCNPQYVYSWITTHYPGKREPEIPLDAFAQARTGICRHIALTVSYYLDRMIRDGLLTGSCYLVRDDLPSGRHAWTLLITDEGAWHIDALWGFIDNAKTEGGYFRMCQRYGCETMERQKERWTDGT